MIRAAIHSLLLCNQKLLTPSWPLYDLMTNPPVGRGGRRTTGYNNLYKASD